MPDAAASRDGLNRPGLATVAQVKYQDKKRSFAWHRTGVKQKSTGHNSPAAENIS